MEYLRIGDRFLCLMPGGNRIYGQVTRRESFVYQANLTAVGAAATGAAQAIAFLNPPKTPARIYQVRWGIAPGWRVLVQHPQGKAAFAPDRDPVNGWLDADNVHHLEMNEHYELFLAPDVFPMWQFQNLIAAIRTPTVFVEGMKYDFDPITDSDTIAKMESGELPYARIIVGSMESIQA